MKTRLIMIAVLLAASPLFGQATATSSQTSSSQPRILTEEDLQQFLIGTVWSWQRHNHEEETIQFFADGTARQSTFVAKFVVKNTTEVELLLGRDRAKLTFDKTYSHYDGIDFHESRPVHGERQK